MTEVLVIAIVAIVVVGPKDLPKLLRTVGKTISGVKRMAGDFQQQFNDAIDDADLGDVKNLATGKRINPLDSIKDATNDVMADINNDLNDTGKKTSGSDEPLFPENETSKKLAKMTAKNSKPSPSAPTKKMPAKKSSTKKLPAKKAPVKKLAAKKTTAKAKAPKKVAVKKSVSKKPASRSKSKSA